MKRGFVLVLVLGAACGGAGAGAGGGAQDGGTPATAAASCTGPVPLNSTMCPGTGAGLASDAPRVVTGSSCAAGTPCSYVCDPGFVVSGGACVTATSAPAAQFTDNADGTITVTDAVGRLTWLREANCADAGSWDDAVAWAGGLASGACGLRDGSVQGDWRLPSHVELMHLVRDLDAANPFPSVQSGNYWSSWTYWPDKAGAVDFFSGEYFDYLKTSQFQVWPVR